MSAFVKGKPMTEQSTFCPYCGKYHQSICPMIKAIEYFPDGTIKRVEILTPADYTQKLSGLKPPYIVTCGG